MASDHSCAMGRSGGGAERTPLLADRQHNTSYHHNRKHEYGAHDAGRRWSTSQIAVRWMASHWTSLLSAVLFSTVVTALCVHVGIELGKAPKHNAPVCMTPECFHASSEILHNLSPNYKNIDPCTDFEKLVCEGWDETHELRPDQGDAFTGTIMSETSQTLLKHILEAPYPKGSKHSSFSPMNLLDVASSVDEQNFDKLKAAYDACMDEDTIKQVGIEPLHEILKEVMDMFRPVDALSKSDASNPQESDDVSDVVEYLGKLGVSALISTGVGADDKDPDTVVVNVSPPYSIGLPAKDYYMDEKILGKYEDTIKAIFENLFPHLNMAQNMSHQIVQFEKALSTASPDSEDRDDVTQYYNPMPLKEADKLTPQLHLSSIIGRFSPADVAVDRIIVTSPRYMKDLSKTLSHSSRAVLQAYFVWKVIQSYASVIEAEALQPYSRFKNGLQGKDPDSKSERWRTCVAHVDDGLGWILSRFYVERAFSEKAKNFGDQVVSDIKDMFITKLNLTTWMDQSVVDLAIEKVHKIVQKIGYPTKSPDIMDPSSLQNYYRSLNISPIKFFQNALSMNKFSVARSWSGLGKPVDRDEWGMSVPTVNAYYNPPGNEIVFPAGIMQFPVFDVNVPQYLSYGAFGSVSGHELSHAFDSTGRHYDQNGNYTDWWTARTVDTFEKRADCFVEQYGNYSIPGPDNKPLHVNGKLTLGENIADAGGVSAAFAAWKMRQAERENEDLPGLEFFTQDQLFFVAYANWWCGKSRKETAISRIYTDPHAPKWVRILGTMANSRDFKESFKCEKKEPVCELW